MTVTFPGYLGNKAVIRNVVRPFNKYMYTVQLKVEGSTCLIFFTNELNSSKTRLNRMFGNNFLFLEQDSVKCIHERITKSTAPP
ncbi:hypothetical protein D3C77_659520 [compost metagenome]